MVTKKLRRPAKTDPLRNAKLWIRALESGKYKQTRGTLAKIHPKNKTLSHCCLGVLCEVALKDGCKVQVSEQESSVLSPLRKFYGGQGSHPPRRVGAWIGTHPDYGYLAELNDTQGWSFKRIAAYLREYYGLPARKR